MVFFHVVSQDWLPTHFVIVIAFVSIFCSLMLSVLNMRKRIVFSISEYNESQFPGFFIVKVLAEVPWN